MAAPGEGSPRRKVIRLSGLTASGRQRRSDSFGVGRGLSERVDASAAAGANALNEAEGPPRAAAATVVEVQQAAVAMAGCGGQWALGAGPAFRSGRPSSRSAMEVWQY